ncbi:MAG: T9SS type A sorting domain-containing protein [Bacteroidales bacterium]
MKKFKLLFLLSLLTFGTMPYCWTNTFNEINAVALPAPINVVASDFETNAVFVTWEYPHDMTYIFFEVYRSTTPYGTFTKIGICYETEWIDSEAWPTIKPPQNVSASSSYSNGILISWSDPVLLPKSYYYKIKAREAGGQNRTSAYSPMDVGSMLDYLDTQSARIFVSESALGPYSLLADNLPSPATGTSTYWHNPLLPATTKYYRITVSLLYSLKPSDQSTIIIGSTITPTLTGPSLVCTNNTTFYLNGTPPGSTVSWTKSTNLTIVSSDYSSCTVTSNGSQLGWIEAIISGVPNPLRKDVWVGPPVTDYVSGPLSGYIYNSYYFNAYPPKDYLAEASYYWSVSPTADLYPDYSGANIYFYYPSGYQVTVQASNSCGSSNMVYTWIDIYDNGYYSLSPNPASTEVTITVTKSNSEQSSLINENIIYEVSIYNMYGMLQTQKKYMGDKFTIPVYNLKEGSYFVKINNGQSVISKQLIIKR